jgi:hypothetical protein
MKTRNGIVYDLNLSNYRHKVNDITYIFSSLLHKEKFIKRLEDNRKTFYTALTNRYDITIEFNNLADIMLYKKIETRGFLIINGRGDKICQKEIKLSGETLMKIN